MTDQFDTVCRCACGRTEFRVTHPPLFRLICHCTICQAFNDAPTADVAVCRSADVERPADGSVAFDTCRPPPNVQRGKCTYCSQPAIELFETPLAPKLTIVPARMFATPSALPDPVAHIFYECRTIDVDDDLPKHSGYIRSQLAFARHLLRGVFSG